MRRNSLQPIRQICVIRVTRVTRVLPARPPSQFWNLILERAGCVAVVSGLLCNPAEWDSLRMIKIETVEP